MSDLSKFRKRISKAHTYVIVDQVRPETMQGETQVIKELNSYLTRQFVMTREVPDDECLREAQEIIAIVDKHKKHDPRDLAIEVLREALEYYSNYMNNENAQFTKSGWMKYPSPDVAKDALQKADEVMGKK